MNKKLKKILEGWSNVVFPNPEAEQLAKARAEICAGCKRNIMSICFECGCPLVAKCRSVEEMCPLDKW